MHKMYYNKLVKQMQKDLEIECKGTFNHWVNKQPVLPLREIILNLEKRAVLIVTPQDDKPKGFKLITFNHGYYNLYYRMSDLGERRIYDEDCKWHQHIDFEIINLPKNIVINT